MPGDIEFLPEERDDEFAGLEPDPAPPARPRWTVWAARGAVVAVIGAVLAVWVATRPSGPSTAPHADPAAIQPVPSVSTQPELHFDRKIVMCQYGAPVETEVAQAMHRYLPKIVLSNTMSYRCVRGSGSDQRIISESVAGTYRGVEIQVDLMTTQADPAAILHLTPEPRHRLVLLGTVQTESAGLMIQIRARGRSGTALPMDQLRNLASFLSLNILL